MSTSHDAATPDPARARLTGAALASAAGCALVALTAAATDTRLGAPVAWTWVLTGVQVLALWAAGRHKWWAWLLGAGVQPVWIAYALFTAQLGFVPGCLVSAAVQVRNYLATPRERTVTPPRAASARARGWR